MPLYWEWERSSILVRVLACPTTANFRSQRTKFLVGIDHGRSYLDPGIGITHETGLTYLVWLTTGTIYSKKKFKREHSGPTILVGRDTQLHWSFFSLVSPRIVTWDGDRS